MMKIEIMCDMNMVSHSGLCDYDRLRITHRMDVL